MREYHEQDTAPLVMGIRMMEGDTDPEIISARLDTGVKSSTLAAWNSFIRCSGAFVFFKAGSAILRVTEVRMTGTEWIEVMYQGQGPDSHIVVKGSAHFGVSLTGWVPL